MKLEDSIKQAKFKNERHKAVLNILYTNNWLADRIKKMLKKHGITMQQYNVLRILKGQYPNPVTTSAIRERMLDNMSDVSRIVERLQAKGFVERNACQEDRRLVDVLISSKGIRLLAKIARQERAIDGVIDQITGEEAALLNIILDKIRSADEAEAS